MNKGQPVSPLSNKKHLARLERENLQRRYLLIGSIVLIVVVILVIGFGFLDQNVLKYNKAVAQVNGQSITLGEFQAQVRFQRWRLIQQYTQILQTKQMFGDDEQFGQYFQQQLDQVTNEFSDPKTIGDRVLTDMIDSVLIEQEAKKRGITVTDAEINAGVEEAFGYFPKGTPTTAPTRPVIPTSTFSPTQLAIVTLTPVPTEGPTPTETPDPNVTPTPAGPTATATLVPSATPNFTPTVTSSPTPYTEALYKDKVKGFWDSLKGVKFSEADLRTVIRSQLLRQKLLEAMTQDIKNTQEQVWARHILVKDEATANDVLKRLKAGEDWAKLAKELSTDTGNKDQGGDLGWFPRGQMEQTFEDVAFSLKVGDTTPTPVKTSFGYHLIQVLGHEDRPVSAAELDTMKQTKLTEWLTSVNTEETVKKFDLADSDIPSDPSLSGN
jgi:parvulin-like peptidyl-prolyl isomerase